MGVIEIAAIVVIAVGFPLVVLGAFKLLLSADQSEDEGGDASSFEDAPNP